MNLCKANLPSEKIIESMYSDSESFSEFHCMWRMVFVHPETSKYSCHNSRNCTKLQSQGSLWQPCWLACGDIPLPICICLVTGTCCDAASGAHPPGCLAQTRACIPDLSPWTSRSAWRQPLRGHSLCSLLQLRKQMLNGCPQVYRADSWMVDQTPVLFVLQACDTSEVDIHHLPMLPQLGSSSALVITCLHSFHILIS